MSIKSRLLLSHFAVYSFVKLLINAYDKLVKRRHQLWFHIDLWIKKGARKCPHKRGTKETSESQRGFELSWSSSAKDFHSSVGSHRVESCRGARIYFVPCLRQNFFFITFIHQAANFVNSALSGNAIANNSLTDNINLLFLFRGCIETGQWRMCYMSGRLVYRYEAIPGPDWLKS